VAEAAYLDAEAGSFSDSGYLARVGARWRLIKILEVGGFVRYDDPGDLDGDGENEDDEVYELNAMVYVWRIVVGLGYETQSDVDTYNLFARFTF